MDFLVGPNQFLDNDALAVTGQFPVSAGTAFSESFGQSATHLLTAKGEMDRFDTAAGLKPNFPERAPNDEIGFSGGMRAGPKYPPSDLPKYKTPVLSKEQLNEKYGSLGLKFDSPMSQGAAEIMADMKRAEIRRADVYNRATTAGAFASIGGSFLDAMTDPLEMAAMAIPAIGAVGRVGSTAAMATRWGRVAAGARAGAVEGVFGAAAIEPVYAGLSRDLQLDYTLTDFAMNIMFGGIFGGGFGAIGGAFARKAELDLQTLDVPENTPAGVFKSKREGMPDIELAYREAKLDPAMQVMVPQRIREIAAQIDQKEIAKLAEMGTLRNINNMNARAFATNMQRIGLETALSAKVVTKDDMARALMVLRDTNGTAASEVLTPRQIAAAQEGLRKAGLETPEVKRASGANSARQNVDRLHDPLRASADRLLFDMGPEQRFRAMNMAVAQTMQDIPVDVSPVKLMSGEGAKPTPPRSGAVAPETPDALLPPDQRGLRYQGDASLNTELSARNSIAAEAGKYKDHVEKSPSFAANREYADEMANTPEFELDGDDATLMAAVAEIDRIDGITDEDKILLKAAEYQEVTAERVSVMARTAAACLMR